MDHRYGWHIRPARSHDSDYRMGSRVIIRPRELSHPRNPTVAPPQFHRAGPPIQPSQDFEREDGNESADMSISEESADDDLHIAQAEEPALPAQEEMGIHQDVDVELELSLTGGRKKKNQHGAYGASTASVDARPSSADIHPFLSLSISSPLTTVTVRQPPSPHAPSSSPGQGSDDVGKAGRGGLSLNLGEAMFSKGLRSHLVQRENKETFQEASVDDVDWDWRERLVHGATSGRGNEESSVDAVSEVEAGEVESGMVISSQCGEMGAVMNTTHALETTREITGSKLDNSMPNGVVSSGQQGDVRPKPPPPVATCLPVPPIRPQPEAAPPMASPLPPHTLPKRRAPSDMPPAPPPVHQGATLAVVQAHPGFEIVDSSSDDDDGFSILVNSVPRKDTKRGPTISPPPPTLSLKPSAASAKPPHPSSPSTGGPPGAALQPSAAPSVGSVRGKVGSGMGRGLGKTGGPMKWQRPLTKPRSPVVPLPSNGTLAARGLAPKKAFLFPVPSATKGVRGGFGSSYTRMGHSYTLVRAPIPVPSQLPPATKPITSPLPSSARAPSVLPPASPVVPPISDANRVEGSRGGAGGAPPAPEKYSRKKANQLVRGGSTPRKNAPSSTSLQATSGPVEAQISVRGKQSVVVGWAEKSMFSSKPSPPPDHGSSKKAVLSKMAKVWRMHASSPPLLATPASKAPLKAGTPLLRFSGRGSKAKQSLAGGSRWTVLSKLKRERKVESLYVRSEGGFALLRSRVRSLVGSSLRWTKTMQEEAKRVSSVRKRMGGRGVEGMGSEGGEVVQEATKAVALAERARREKKQKAKAAKTESSKGEGRQRYKVGAAGKALHRLPGEGKAWRAPRRAQIGGASYVRMGGSSGLVRDPNSAAKHTASARVRYSLNNARLRKVKARAYCQYFCRFGKCGKKEEGECGYIHDPDKVAVCSNWLNAVCAEHNCPLTHEVRAERMPDCSFFQEGMCVVEECPYRHVNVNPKAAVCQGFLRGHCAQGDKCTQKHTFMCPDQSALGACSKGSHCKLQHKGLEADQKGGLRSTVQAARGRYFEGKRKREGAQKEEEEEEEERKEEGSAKRAKYGGSQEEEEEEEEEVEEDFIPI